MSASVADAAASRGPDPHVAPGAASARIADHLRTAILDGAIAPGERVRQEEVAQATGSSRIPVREALHRLEAEGLIENEPNKGARVPLLSPHEVDLIYRMRERLEPLALVESLPHLTAADLERLTAEADIRAAPAALEWAAKNASVTGALHIPSLSIRPISDIAGPQYDSWYAARVKEAGASDRLRQVRVQELGHCHFTSAEEVAAVTTVRARIETGGWGDSTTPQALQKLADSLDLGPAKFIAFQPGKFLSDRDRQP